MTKGSPQQYKYMHAIYHLFLLSLVRFISSSVVWQKTYDISIEYVSYTLLVLVFTSFVICTIGTVVTRHYPLDQHLHLRCVTTSPIVHCCFPLNGQCCL